MHLIASQSMEGYPQEEIAHSCVTHEQATNLWAQDLLVQAQSRFLWQRLLATIDACLCTSQRVLDAKEEEEVHYRPGTYG